MASAAHSTRPDIAFDVRSLSTKSSNPSIGDLKDANKTLKKLQSKNVEVKFKKLGELKLLLLFRKFHQPG